MGLLLTIVAVVLLLFQLVLVARAVLDWSQVLAGPAAHGSVRWRLIKVAYALTEPVLAPVRRIVPPLRIGAVGIDLAFIIVFVAVIVLRQLLVRF
jgi:YggT family protein